MRKISQRRFAAIVLIVLMTMIVVSNYEMLKVEITGLALITDLEVSINSWLAGKIILAYDILLEIGEVQHIYAEFINIGTENYTAKIEEHIYFYNVSKMDLQISYYDIEVPLQPGGRRGFRTAFKPPAVGLYYIKVRVPYELKVAQEWGSFYVYTTVYPTTTVSYPGVPAPGPAVTTTLGIAKVIMEVPDNVTIVEGGSRTFGVEIKNVGERALNNLRFYISAPNVLNVNINPKVVAKLGLNKSTSFLITVDVVENTSIGVYPIELELTTNELKESRIVDIVVVPSNISLIKYFQDLILNYEYLIDRIESEIYTASLDGYDVSLANESLNNAKTSLESAKRYLQTQDFDNTEKQLENTIKYLEDAVFHLASSMLYVYRPPAYYPLLLLLVEGLIAIGIFFIFFWNRRRKRRPEALKEAAAGLESV